MYFAIGGIQIKNPTTITFEDYNLTKGGRLASGKMTLDLVAKKRKFLLHYDIISSSALASMLSVANSDTLFYTFEYTEDDVQKTAQVYTGDLTKTPSRGGTNVAWCYSDFEIHFIEQ
jgi:hypothetical protein